MKIVTISQMQQAERDCARYNVSLDMLMEKAGRAVAEETCKIAGDIRSQNILILVGPGNNGGDGLVAARYLYDRGVGRVKVYLCAGRPENDPNLEAIKQRGIHFRQVSNDVNFNKLNEWLYEACFVLDSVFGTGKVRPLGGELAGVLSRLSEAAKKRPGLRVIAVDLPSGTNADTGEIDPATPDVHDTFTLGFPKVGLFNLPAAAKAGKISVLDIGIPAVLVDSVNISLLDEGIVKPLLPVRSMVGHKGSYGKVMAFTGSMKYSGAACLSCLAALRAGAGLTTLAVERSLYNTVASRMMEVTYLPLPDPQSGSAWAEAGDMIHKELPGYDVFLTGCGLGQDPPQSGVIKALLLDLPVQLPGTIVDADGLNILSTIPGWWERFEQDAILTPHAGEMSRLLDRPVAEIQSNRIGIAGQAAERWHKTVVLKGAYTVIASPDGRIFVSPFANPGLATAGTGDVLSGSIAGMLAQGLSLLDAAICGVYIHGLAGEMLRNKLGDAGILAGDLLPVLPLAIRQLKEI